MAVLHAPGEGGTFIDVLDRVLDKGIVIDAWGRVSVAGIDLIGLEMKVVVASIETYLRYADVLGVGTHNGEIRTNLPPH
jgi:gas vesicle structural protein